MKHTLPPPSLAFDWRDYRPLARAEARKFYRRFAPGQFKYEDLLRVAGAELALSPGHKYAREAIRGALADFVRGDLTVVKPVELTEAKYRATAAELDDLLETAHTARPAPCNLPCDSRLAEDWRELHGVTVGPPPRRIRRRVRHPITGEMCELLPSRLATSLGYKVSSKHGKVSVAIKRAPYDDDRGQEIGGGMIRARIEGDEQRDFDPRISRETPQRGGGVDQTGYGGRGRKKDEDTFRFAASCFNDGRIHKRGLDDGIGDWIGPRMRWPRPTPKLPPEDVREYIYYGPAFLRPGGGAGPRMHVKSPAKVDMTKLGLEPVSKDKLGAWRYELAEEASTCVDIDIGRREPTLRASSWHRDAESGKAPEFKGASPQEISMHPETDTRSANAKRQARFRERKRAARAAKALRSADWAEAIDEEGHGVLAALPWVPSVFVVVDRRRPAFFCS